MHKQGLTYAEIRPPDRPRLAHPQALSHRGGAASLQSQEGALKLDPFKDIIQSWLEKEPRLRATRIHQDLVRDYGTGNYETVRRYVEQLMLAKHSALTEERFETAAGHQAQVDWSMKSRSSLPRSGPCHSTVSTWS